MEKELLQVGHNFITNGGTEVVCYDVSENFAFLAPVEVVNDEVILVVEKTLVYKREVTEEVLSPIQSISFGTKDTDTKAE